MSAPWNTLTVTIELDWGDENDLRSLVEPLMDWVTEEGRIDDHRFKYGVSTTLSYETHDEETQ